MSGDMQADGWTVVVTGAASGIGDAVARRFGEAGASVISLDIKTPSANVERHLETDLASPASIDAAVASIDRPLNAVINVAGVPGTAPDERVFAVNFLGLRHLTNALLPHLVEGGAVVNVASTAGFEWPARLPQIQEVIATTSFEGGRAWFSEHQPDDVAAYHFSKEVVTVWTMSEALNAAQRGLRINAVSPGPVETPILGDFEESMGKELLDGVREMVGRHGRPQDIAPLVVFLASPAAGWVNGHNLVADGGALGAVVSGAVALPAS